MSPYLALLADVQTPQISSMPWTEMAAFFAVVAILGGARIPGELRTVQRTGMESLMPVWAQLLLAHAAGFVIGGGVSFLCLRLRIQSLAFDLMKAEADLALEKSRRP